MKKHLYFCFASLAFFFLLSCNKDDNSDEQDQGEELTSEEVTYFDSQPNIEVSLEDIILPNGESVSEYQIEIESGTRDNLKTTSRPGEDGPQASKNKMLASMIVAANYLVTDSNFQYTGNDMITGFPAQDGLAYSFGSKEFSVRQSPPFGECTDDVYGLDCSGFIYHIFKAAGIDIPVGQAEDQRKVEILNNSIKEIPGFNKIKFEDFGQIPQGEFETGDIIYWLRGSKAFHIGIVLKTRNEQMLIFQSNGTGKSANNCAENYKKNRGPRTIQPGDFTLFNSRKYGIVRMTTDISGTWSVNLRCSGQQSDALTLNITIPVNEGGAFTANGSGTDYDGAPITAQLAGEYDKQQNTLSGIFTLLFPENPDDVRKDSFTVKLEKDETEYLVMTKVVDNTGCVLEMNNEITTTSRPPEVAGKSVPGIFLRNTGN
jgi:hypothetical protein